MLNSILSSNIITIKGRELLIGNNKFRPFNQGECVIFNFTTAVKFYPDVSTVIEKDTMISADFKNYISDILSAGFNCQNYKRDGEAFKQVLTYLTLLKVRGEVPSLAIMSDESLIRTIQRFQLETFILNQKYRQTNIDIGYVIPTYSSDIIDKFRDIQNKQNKQGKQEKHCEIDLKDLLKYFVELLRFPTTQFRIAQIYKELRESYKFKGDIMSQIYLSTIIKDCETLCKPLTTENVDNSLTTENLENSLTTENVNDSQTTEKYRILMNILTMICVRYKKLLIIE